MPEPWLRNTRAAARDWAGRSINRPSITKAEAEGGRRRRRRRRGRRRRRARERGRGLRSGREGEFMRGEMLWRLEQGRRGEKGYGGLLFRWLHSIVVAAYEK